MIRVAFDLRDPRRSGLGRVASSLAAAFAQLGDEQFHLTWCGPEAELRSLRDETGRDDIRVIDWSAGRYSPQSQVLWPGVRRAARSDLWFFPHWDVPWFGMPAQSVVMVHDLIHLRIPGAAPAWRRLMARSWMTHAIANARRALVVSQFTRGELLALWPEAESKVVVVPNGVNGRFFAPAPDVPSDLRAFADRGRFMLSVGNRKWHKNLIMGPEVLARVPGLRWVVVGEHFPEWQDVERRMDTLGLADRVLALPPQSDDVLHALYASAACLFFPSRCEGFGLPLLEALAVGTPVVAARAGAIPETLGGFGELCDPDDAEGFATAVARALTSGTAARDAARTWARQFTWRSGAERLAAVFQNIAAVGH